MIFVVNAENRRLFESDLMEMHRQRKAVFVDRIGWKIPVVTDMEIDRYDRDDTIYLLAKDRPEAEMLAAITPEGLRGVRERHGITVPVTRCHANASPCSHRRCESYRGLEGGQVLDTLMAMD